MNNKTELRHDIVSAEKEIFSGNVLSVAVTGKMGEIGVAPGHSPLITNLKPGNVQAVLSDTDDEEIFYISGGMLEVQPTVVTILADTALRAHDIDEAAALEAKQKAEQTLSEKRSEVDFARAASELAQAAAQLRAIQRLKGRNK
jgi:F-type H+-transporting ATPase subunit epsilon